MVPPKALRRLPVGKRLHKGAKAKAFLSECIFLLKSLDGTKFIFLKIFSLTKTIWLWKRRVNSQPEKAKSAALPVDMRRIDMRLCISYYLDDRRRGRKLYALNSSQVLTLLNEQQGAPKCYSSPPLFRAATEQRTSHHRTVNRSCAGQSKPILNKIGVRFVNGSKF